jgi:adenosylcobinamide-phosphate synthase
MRTDRVYAYGATLGFLADLVAGDPRHGHPVAAFGRAAGALERRLWHDDRATGTAYTALCAAGAVGAAALARRSVRCCGALSVALTAATTWSVLGGTSLAREARAVAASLEAGDLAAARARLPHLCGRDPDGLDAAGIARAVVESVAENTSDAVVGALVWGALGGVPGLVGFRAANTLDAMVGHRSPRHLRFGWASARLDDLAGYPGARLTATLAVLAGPHPRSALRTWHRDAKAHPSPNAGPVEAAFAGALRLRLGGPLSYGGRTEHRAVLGARYPSPTTSDITRAIRLSRRVSALALAASVLASVALEDRRAPGQGRTTAAGEGDAGSPRPGPPADPGAAAGATTTNPPRPRDAVGPVRALPTPGVPATDPPRQRGTEPGPGRPPRRGAGPRRPAVSVRPRAADGRPTP